jgi:broad specificity phosphatase PhoE
MRDAARRSTPPTPAETRDRVEARLRAFASEVARRHRGRPVDPSRLVVALRGYYRTWAIFERLPPLDDAAIAFAVDVYRETRGGRGRTQSAPGRV